MPDTNLEARNMQPGLDPAASRSRGSVLLFGDEATAPLWLWLVLENDEIAALEEALLEHLRSPLFPARVGEREQQEEAVLPALRPHGGGRRTGGGQRAGGALEPRTISSNGITLGPSGSASPFAARMSRSAARAVMAEIGWRIAVRGGDANLTMGVSSKLTIDRSRGTSTPRDRATSSAASDI